ncbi:hypothetical protein AUP07_0936 [methanogenic archaeon mixed culture ISO4-G1]|nr:hypothetical protein AUP07_0936 [methanogenic archaeon mixed culture ISO4-G1]
MLSDKMKVEIVDCLALLGGVVIAVAFFLPWAGDMNGFGYSDYIRSLEGSLYFIFSIALYFVFILGLGIVLEAILSIVGSIRGRDHMHSTFFGYVIIIMALLVISANMISMDSMALGTGIIVGFIGCFIALMSGVITFRKGLTRMPAKEGGW